MATRQPSFSSPTRLATGTRTSSKKTSLNSLLPRMVSRGRMSMPGVSMGTINQEIPLCFGASGSVRTSSSQYWATWAWLVQIFCPLMTYSSPSRTARVRRLARSEPAWGSEKPWHQQCSPLRIAGRWNCFCSSEASVMIVGPAWRRPTKLVPTYGAPTRSVSSRKIMCSTGEAPRPPYSFGQLMPAYPASKSMRCHRAS